MTVTDRVSFRTDSETKKQAEQIAGELGTNTSAILNVFLHAFVRHRGIPFDVALPETRRRRPSQTPGEPQPLVERGGKPVFLTPEEQKSIAKLQYEAIQRYVEDTRGDEEEPFDEEFDAMMAQRLTFAREGEP